MGEAWIVAVPEEVVIVEVSAGATARPVSVMVDVVTVNGVSMLSKVIFQYYYCLGRYVPDVGTVLKLSV